MDQRDEFPAVEVLTSPGWAVAASAAAPTILLTSALYFLTPLGKRFLRFLQDARTE